MDKKFGWFYCQSNCDLDVAMGDESETQDQLEPDLFIWFFSIELLHMQNIV